MTNDTPMIWTTKGNLLEADLTVRHGWEDSPTATVFWQEHYLGDELVKRAAHVLSKIGVTGDAVTN